MKRKMMTTLSTVLAAVMLMTGCGAGTDRNSDEVSTQEHDENAMVHLDGLEDVSKLFDDIYAQVSEDMLPAWLWRKYRNVLSGGMIYQLTQMVAVIALLILCTAYLIDGSFNPFLYFRF